MSFNAKQAADRLLKIADELEKAASLNTFYICNACSHTSSLANINDRRTKVASEGGFDKVSKVTIQDKVACPACQGVMEYVPTEDSEKYYIQVSAAEDTTGIAQAAVPYPSEEETEEVPPQPAKKPPVDNSQNPEEAEAPVLESEPPEGGAIPAQQPQAPAQPEAQLEVQPESQPEAQPQPEEAPAQPEVPPQPEQTEDNPEEESPESIFEPVDVQDQKMQQVKDQEEGEDAPQDGDDGQSTTPKFTEMPEDIKEMTDAQKKKGPGRPKQAGERFWGSVARYASIS